MSRAEEALTGQEKADRVSSYRAQCNGSLNMYDHWTKRLIYSDGVALIAEVCGAHWLIDLIASHQIEPLVARESFQVWTLSTFKSNGDDRWLAQATDGDENVITEQVIEFSDIPLELLPLVLYLEGRTLMIPEER